MARNMRFSKFHHTILIIGILAILTSVYAIISSIAANTYSFGEYDYGILIGALLILFYVKSDKESTSQNQSSDDQNGSKS